MIINKKLNKVINNTDSESEALLDLTADTVAPENLLLNKTAHNRDGEGIVGEMNEGGTSDYDELQNRPSINSHTLTGNKTGAQLGLQNRVLASTLNIGGQTIGSVEGALSALNESKSDLVNGKVPVNELPVYQPVIGSIQSVGGIVPPSSSGDEDKYLRSDGTWAKPAGGGGGVTDYDDLTNRPKVNGTTLSGDKTGTQLGLQNIILSSTMTIGGQTITEVEPALHALNNKPSGSGGHTILDEDGTTYPQRSKLQFEGCEVTDDAVNDTTIVTCVGGGSIYAKPVMASSSFTYNGSAQSPTLTGFDSEAMTITGDYEATNAGNYSFTVALKDKTKSKWIDNTTTDLVFNWSIGKADSNTTASAASVTLNTSNTSRTVTLSNVTGTVTVSSSDTSVATASVSNNTVTIAGVNHKDGSATITISIATSTNYKAKTLTVSVSASYVSTISVTLYSAASDTVSFTDKSGSKTAVTDTSGKKTSVRIVIPYNGKTITFTSSVAKNPSKLSNAYSKSIALTRSTTEIKVMPDGALYWYGWINNDAIEEINTANGWTYSRGFTAPVYGTNNVAFNSNKTVSGLSSKNIGYANTTAKAVVTTAELYAGTGAWLVRLSKKEFSDNNTTVVESETTTAVSSEKQLLTLNCTSGNYYLATCCGYTRKGTMYALWTE